MHLTTLQWSLGALAALLAGFSKTGVTGLGVLIVPLMASLFEAKASTGAVLPMLVFADIFAVAVYRRHAQWPVILRLLPWILPGIIAGSVTLKEIDSESLSPVLGGLVLSMVALQVVRQRAGGWLETHLPHQWWFSAAVGFLAGFATMVGNIAGPIMGIYLISMGLEKRQFMGTGAWYYLIVNLVKVPFGVWHAQVITAESLKFNLAMAPIIAVGALLGIVAFPRIPQVWFNRAVLLLAVLGGVRLLFR